MDYAYRRQEAVQVLAGAYTGRSKRFSFPLAYARGCKYPWVRGIRALARP
jgi:hypothetical protein